MGRPIITKEPTDFRTRFLKSLNAPWLFFMVGFTVFFSLKFQFIWLVGLFFVTIFIFLNYNAMEQFLTKIELVENSIEITYYNSKMDKQILEIPLSELTAEYYGNSIGFSSFTSGHMRIKQKGKTLIRQYKTDEWTTDYLKNTTKRLNELKI